MHGNDVLRTWVSVPTQTRFQEAELFMCSDDYKTVIGHGQQDPFLKAQKVKTQAFWLSDKAQRYDQPLKNNFQL